MRIDRVKLDFELADQCKTISVLRSELSSSTLTRIRKGCEINTRTAGKLARALNVPLERIIETTAENVLLGIKDQMKGEN